MCYFAAEFFFQMQLFYQADIDKGSLFLDSEEARHAAKVLRKNAGDLLHVTDGKGNLYEVQITQITYERCLFRVLGVKNTAPPPFLHIAVAPTKNLDRFEWLVEKCTEFGVTHITPLLTQRCELRQHIKLERLQKIAAAAMKQSLKYHLPLIQPALDLAAFLRQYGNDALPSSEVEQRFIAYIETPPPPHLKSCYVAPLPVCVLIGPEGDFTEAEVAACEAHGFERVSLGGSRLRTETAAIAACHLIQVLREQ